ncbi:MAG TPA: HDOD domain-containing protein, partial [Conexibacter sp.]|nr:HDOD domain-containing protein [Conexibacter sp.]
MVRHHNEGHGRRLTAAFEALEAFPVLAESRNRVLRLFTQDRPSTADVVTAVESDVALAIATLRLANRVDGRSRGRVDSVVRAVSVLSPAAVQALASRARTFDFFEPTGIWEGTPERFRLHGVATQRAADRLAAELGYEERDRLMVTSLLHD